MVRGRKKDLSIPLTRTLAQQREYRARRTQYIEHLEERCKAAEEECQRLREELATVKSAKLIDAHPQIVSYNSKNSTDNNYLSSQYELYFRLKHHLSFFNLWLRHPQLSFDSKKLWALVSRTLNWLSHSIQMLR